MKAMRHAMITQLVETMEIDTQEMLSELLLERGIKVTQATISRDIKDLRLVKVLTDHGTYKYVTAERTERSVTERLMRLFTESVVAIIEAENLIVIKTLPATANVAAEAIDGMNWPEIAGTLAGENSVFVAVRSKDTVPDIAARFRAMMQ